MNAPLASVVARANLIANVLGPLLIANDCDGWGLACAQANFTLKQPGWCDCNTGAPEPPEEAYYRDAITGAHGWICCRCRKVTQLG